MQEEPTLLHGVDIARKNSRKIKKQAAVFCMIALVALCVIVFSLVWRNNSHLHNPRELPSQWLTITATIVSGASIIFLWGMKMTPLLAYRRYLKDIHSGLTRAVEGTIAEVQQEMTFREGLFYYAVMLMIAGEKQPERLLYWDVQLGKPPMKQGEQVRIIAHGNDIIAFQRG